MANFAAPEAKVSFASNGKSRAQSLALLEELIASKVYEFSSRIVSVKGGDTAEPRNLFFSDVTTSSGVDYTHRSANWLHELRRKSAKTASAFNGLS